MTRETPQLAAQRSALTPMDVVDLTSPAPDAAKSRSRRRSRALALEDDDRDGGAGASSARSASSGDVEITKETTTTTTTTRAATRPRVAVNDDDEIVVVSESAPTIGSRMTQRERTRKERVERASAAGGLTALGAGTASDDGAGAVGKCAICLDAYVNATSTRCGHVFCARCIAAAYKHSGKCPTCRKKVDKKSLRRIFV